MRKQEQNFRMCKVEIKRRKN